MTVGIGMICEGGKAAILIADRQRTYGVLKSDEDVPKIHCIGEEHVAIASCNECHHEIRCFLSELAPGRTVKPLVDAVQTKFEELSDDKRNRILRQAFGVEFERFRRSLIRAHAGSFGYDLANQVKLTKLEMHILVVGSAENGEFRVFTVGHEGPFECESRGFSAVGSGAEYAIVSLTNRQYDKNCTIATAIISANEAKRAAELANGVGVKSDIVVIQQGKKRVHLRGDKLAKVEAISKRVHEIHLTDDDRQLLNTLLIDE